MITEILTVLKSNTTLASLLSATQQNSRIYATHTDYLGNCIIYNEYTTAANKITNNTRLTISIIADSLAKTHSIEDEVKESLLTLADNPLTTNILQVSLSGGGSIYDYDRQKHHRTLYFTIISRSV